MKRRETVSASELAAYSFCERAWGYRRSGVTSANLEALERGSEIHRKHSGLVRLSRAAAAAGWILLVAGLVIIAARLI